jgi:putative transposase
MDAKEVQQQYLLSKWTAIIQECRTSQLSVKDWCLENNVNKDQYFYWQRKVRKQLCASVEDVAKEQAIAFAPLQVEKSCNRAMPTGSFATDLLLNIGGYQLQINNDTDSKLLETVLRVIQNV